MNIVDEEMDFPWPTEPVRDSTESRESPPSEPQFYPSSFTVTCPQQQQQQPLRAKKSMFKKLTGMFRSNNTSPTTPPIPLPFQDSDDTSPNSSGTSNDPYANILSSVAGIDNDPLSSPSSPPPFPEPRSSTSSSRPLFLNGLFTRSQETLSPPPPKKERNVLRKKGSASSLRALRNGDNHNNGSTTSLAKSVREVKQKKSGLAMEIKVPPPPPPSASSSPPKPSQRRPPNLLLFPTPPGMQVEVHRDEDHTSPSLTPSTPTSPETSPSSLKPKSPSLRRPRTLASLPPAPPSPTFPPPPPPPFHHDELPPRRDSLLLPPSSPSSPYLKSDHPLPLPVRVQPYSDYLHEKPPSLTSSSSSSGNAATSASPSESSNSTTNSDPSRGALTNIQPQHPPSKSRPAVLPRLKDPFKQIQYRVSHEEILSEGEEDVDPSPELSDAEIGIRNWTTFANESVERFRAAVGSSEDDDTLSMEPTLVIMAEGKEKKGRKIGKPSNKPTSEKSSPISSLFHKRQRPPPSPSPLTLSPSLLPQSQSHPSPSSPFLSPLPSPLLTPPPLHSPTTPIHIVRPLVKALEDIDIDDVENDTVPKGNYYYPKTTEQQRAGGGGGGRVGVGAGAPLPPRRLALVDL